MIINNSNWNSPVRKIKARVELKNSTLETVCNHNDRLKSFNIERVGDESKFFGFGICQRLNLHLIDSKRELNVDTSYNCKCYLDCGEELDSFPSFKVDEVRRDENTNELSITAYDALYPAAKHTLDEVDLEPPYTILEAAAAIASFLGLGEVVVLGLPEGYNPFLIDYPSGANVEGTETLREALDDIAEATQTIYYIDAQGNLVFKMPGKDAAAALTIGKADYIDLDSKTNRRLSDICSATELGDNVITESGTIGTIQYVRDNPFWVLREDITDLLNNALAAVGGLTINQFECSWRGNPGVEVGDKIALITKDNETVYSFVFDDTIEYDGSLKQQTRWSYTNSDAESADNPASLGEVLKKTYAKVDKVNKQIEIVTGNTETNSSAISSLIITTDGIAGTVQQIQQNTEDSFEIVGDNINTLTQEVSTKVSAEDVSIIVKNEMSNGIDKITTSTGFTFDEVGLHVSKSDSEITTTITEDGMKVFRENNEVLVADNLGVRAEDLHATTFLIIGRNSRFEDYDNDSRTGCFWLKN